MRDKLGRFIKGSVGEKCLAWKGGHSKRYKTGYNSPEYKKWRSEVFKRDNYTCQECGKNKCYITAHHIKSFSKHPKLRFEVSNGLTLCENCHEKTDNYKGKNNKGMKHSKETIKKMKISRIGMNKKLGDKDILDIIINKNNQSHRSLSKKYNVAHSTIGAIKRGEREYSKIIIK